VGIYSRPCPRTKTQMALPREHRGLVGLESTTLWSSQPYGAWMSPWCPTCRAYNHPMEVPDIFADYRLLLPIKSATTITASQGKNAWKTPLIALSTLFTFSGQRGQAASGSQSSKISPSSIRTKQRRMQRLQKREMRRALTSP
jgi:hypothetical protein